MKRLFLLLIAAVAILSSCQKKQNEIIIEGTLKNATDEMVRMALIDIDDAYLLDSVKIQDGHFKFVLKAESEADKARFSSPMLYQIILSYDNTLTTLAQGGDHITIDADAKDLVSNYHVSGGEEAVLMGQLDSALTAFVKPTEKLYETYQMNLENDSARAEIEKQYLIMLDKHKAYLTKFIQEHPNNMASYIAFYQNYNRRSFFSEEEDFAILKKLTDSLKEKYPNNPYIKNMLQHVEVLDMVQKTENE